MPRGEVTTAAPAAGFFGKIPSRGDFVRAGLPRGFVQEWDDWLQRAFGGSRAVLGEGWLDAWMEAPIWRFALPPGHCGADAVLGAWMPSVDNAGRHFPLTLALAATTPDGFVAAGDWLAQAEAAGLEALQSDLPPDALASRLAFTPGGAPEADLTPLDLGYAVWWTEGSPFVPPGRLVLETMPDAAGFARMLRTESSDMDVEMDGAAQGPIGEGS